MDAKVRKNIYFHNRINVMCIHGRSQHLRGWGQELFSDLKI